VFEDIDAIIKKYGESEILSLLDGDNQVDRVINIATTNYPELLDKRIVNRPRRFDRIYKILVPEEKIRAAFLKEKLPKKEDVKLWVKKTRGLSFAAIAETLISVLCLGNKLDDTVKILRDIESKNPKSSDFGSGIGFGADDDDDDDDGPTKCSSRPKVARNG
jgi:SpoVK/Ycf46/Vps4 family AAA+-type ATPase